MMNDIPDLSEWGAMMTKTDISRSLVNCEKHRL